MDWNTGHLDYFLDQGGVWGGCISKCYWLMDFLLDHILPYAINYLCQALIFNLLIKTYFDWLY